MGLFLVINTTTYDNNAFLIKAKNYKDALSKITLYKFFDAPSLLSHWTLEDDGSYTNYKPSSYDTIQKVSYDKLGIFAHK